MFDAIYEAAALQGVPARTLMAEYAPGQFEITLAHRMDALRAIDEAILLVITSYSIHYTKLYDLDSAAY